MLGSPGGRCLGADVSMCCNRPLSYGNNDDNNNNNINMNTNIDIIIRLCNVM